MMQFSAGILVLLLGLPVARGDEPSAAAEQYRAFVKEFNTAANGLWTATTDAQREQSAARGAKITPQLMELAEKNPNAPFAFEALIQVIVQELWLENNTSHAGLGKDTATARAIAILTRDHIRSDKLSDATRRVQYGFRKECETFLRTVLEKSPHRDVQALASLRLAQFLNARLQRLDVLKEKPEAIRRYEGLFGKDYMDELQRQDRAKAIQEVEEAFERAAEKYADVKLPFGGTVGERAKSELFEIRNLTVGKEAPEIAGEDQDGKRFKLGDYRGKVVLLYFWSEF